MVAEAVTRTALRRCLAEKGVAGTLTLLADIASESEASQTLRTYAAANGLPATLALLGEVVAAAPPRRGRRG